MGLIAKYFIGVALGYCSHVLFHKPTMLFGRRWGQLLRYAIGYIGCIIIRQVFLPDESSRENILEADVSTGVMYGAGVFLGYLADTGDE